jgi:transcriptional regulator with XRE-family HTH domain
MDRRCIMVVRLYKGVSVLGQIVAHRRNELGISQEALAEMVGVSRGAIAQIETGTIRQPKQETLLALAKALNLSVRTLLLEAGILPREEATTRELEADIAEVIAANPAFADIIDFAREYPEKLVEVVRYAQYLVSGETGSEVRERKGKPRRRTPTADTG